jgi:zinc protease
MRTNGSVVAALAALTLTGSGLGAQRSAAPRTAPQQAFSRWNIAQLGPDTITSSFVVDGVNVILRRNNANNVVAANLYLLGGVRQVTSATAGIERFLLAVSERGTRNYPRAILRHKMSQLGSQIVIAPGPDWTLFSAQMTTEIVDSTWAIFADRVMNPTIDSADVELVRSQILSEVQQQRDDPDALVDLLADSVAFAGHPYSIPVEGTEASTRLVTATSLKAFHQTQFVKSRMLLVIVGDVTKAHVTELVHKTLGKMPAGSYVWTLPPAVPTTPAPAVLVQRTLPTNYILGYFGGPRASAADYQALRVATTVLTGRMFGEIRSRQNLTYDVHAPFLDRAATAGGLYVTTVAPDTTLKLMKYFVRELQTQVLTDEGLKRLELEFITDYFIDNETNAAQADFLARAQLYQGDYRQASTFVRDLRNVTPLMVRSAALRYFRNIRFAYVGDPNKVDKQLLNSF